MSPTPPPSILILGADTVLAAAPATAVQLTHACLAAGYDAVVPASWGDELVAARVVERMQSMGGPGIQCSCPRVAERFAANGDAIAAMLVCTVSPAVATAEYLRALYVPGRPNITFAGGCPGGAHHAIDAWVPPHELFAALARRGQSLADQPTEFDVLPADRRRFHSEPGGLPSHFALRQVVPPIKCAELHSSDFVSELGQHLLSDEPVLVDVAAALGCQCAGAGAGVAAMAARARVREHEPPRAPGPVVDHSMRVVLDSSAPVMSAVPPVAHPAPAMTPEAPAPLPVPVGVATEPARRRSPAGMPRPVLGTAPRSRTEGRPLPRAYVARRRSSPRGLRTIEPPSADPAAPPDSMRARLAWIGGGVLVGVTLMWLAGLLL